MELFVCSEQPKDTLSMAIEMYANYIRATHRNIVKLNKLNSQNIAALKLKQVSLI